MSDLHHHHDSTIVEDREGPATALMVLIGVAVVAFLIWLFAFSGVFGGDNDSDLNVNVRDGQTEQTDNDTTTGDTGTTDGTGADNTDTQSSP